jgi:GNAT superfamily N-acetyltransferase
MEDTTESMVNVQIIPMSAQHVVDVLVLWKRTEGLILTETDNAHDLESYFIRNPGISHVAVGESRIVGGVLCGHDGRRGYLHHLAVTPDYRNKGIGRALVDACFSKLREAGIGRCNLFVVDDHADGKRFWAKCGWNEWPNIRLTSKDCEEE